MASRKVDWTMGELQRTTEQIQAFRDVIRNGGTIKDALLAAGYTESTAACGVASVPDALLPFLHERGYRLIQLGKHISAEDQQALVRGRLLENVVEGKDAGVNSAKVLGSESRVSMWQPESMTNVVILEAPQQLHAQPIVPAQIDVAGPLKMLDE